MFRISKITDYGIVALCAIGREESGDSLNARDVADRARLPVPTVSKILKILTRSKILISQRGTKGGYHLARPTEQISVADVINALEGPISLTECADHEAGGSCDHECTCPVKDHWVVINRAVVQALSGISLKEMMIESGTVPSQPDGAGFVSIQEESP